MLGGTEHKLVESQHKRFPDFNKDSSGRVFRGMEKTERKLSQVWRECGFMYLEACWLNYLVSRKRHQKRYRARAAGD